MKKVFIILTLFAITNILAQENDSINSVISASVRAVTPIGIFATNWNTGTAYYLSYGWEYSNEWQVDFQIGYNKYRLKSNSSYSVPKLSMLALQIGGKHYFLEGAIKPYVVILSGVNYIRLYYKTDDILVDEREVHMNFQLGTGLNFKLFNDFHLEASVLYNSHLINPSIPYNLTGIEYGFGINLTF